MQALGYQIAPPPWVPSPFAFNQQLPVSPQPVAEPKTLRSQLSNWYGRQYVRMAHTVLPGFCVLSGCAAQMMNMAVQAGQGPRQEAAGACMLERSKLGLTCAATKSAMNVMQQLTTQFNSIHQLYCILGREAPYAVYSYFIEGLNSGNAFSFISSNRRERRDESLHGLSLNAGIQHEPVSAYLTRTRSLASCTDVRFLLHMLLNHVLLAGSVGILVAQQTFGVIMFLAWHSCNCMSSSVFGVFCAAIVLSSVYAMYQLLHCGLIVMAQKEHTEQNLTLQFSLYRQQALEFYAGLGLRGLHEVDRNTRMPPGVPFSLVAYLTHPYKKVNLQDISVVVEATQSEINQLGTFAEERCMKDQSMGRVFVFDQKLPDIPVIPIAMIQDKEGSGSGNNGSQEQQPGDVQSSVVESQQEGTIADRRVSNHRTPFKLHQRIAVYKWFYIHLSTFPSAQSPAKAVRPASMLQFYRVKRYRPVPSGCDEAKEDSKEEFKDECKEPEPRAAKPVEFDDADSSCIICLLPVAPEHLPDCHWVEVRRSRQGERARADPRSPRPENPAEVISFCAASTHCRMHQRCAEAWLWDQASKQCTPKCPVCRLTVPIAVEVVKKVDPAIEDIEQIRKTMANKRISLTIKDHSVQSHSANHNI